ncbi:hypothetical protein [Synechococcus sp. MIT S1220]|uniref:hypothetical protein n=1 Tax=Synechococcus sp. MIT S1220 TaxID=3082549 RepID=UPI0039AF4926
MTFTSTHRHTGQDLITLITELNHVSKEEMTLAAGYSKQDGTPDYFPYYQALLEAWQIPSQQGPPVHNHGEKRSLLEILEAINADPADLEVEYTANRGLTLYWRDGSSNDDPDLCDELLDSLDTLLNKKGCFKTREGDVEAMDLALRFQDGTWQIEGQRYICNVIEERLSL